MKYVVALLLLAGCATVPKPNRIDQLVNTPPFDRAVWGIDVEDDDGHVIYALNAHRLEMPASNRKLFSAATDANCLGATHEVEAHSFSSEAPDAR